MEKQHRTIELVPYSNQWKKYFLKEEQVLKTLLKSNFISAHHIGSTAIKDILTKPTLDVLVVVHTLDGIEYFSKEFKQRGLELKGEHGLPCRLFCIRYAPDKISHLCHIHILEKGDIRINDHLDFCKYLNEEPEIAKEYEDLKVALKNKFKSNPKMYSTGKNEFIQAVLGKIS